MLEAELQRKGGTFCDNFLQRELRDHAILVFKFHRQVGTGQDGFGEVENVRQPAGSETMMVVRPNQGLQHARLAGTKRSAAVDKLFCHVPDFGDVKMPRNPAAARQQDGDAMIRRCEETRF